MIGACRVELALSGVDSLKAKRSIVRSVLDRTRAKFDVTAAEVEAMDEHTRAVLGFVVVSNERAHAEGRLRAIHEFVEHTGLARVRQVKTEFTRILEGRATGGDVVADWSDFEADE